MTDSTIRPARLRELARVRAMLAEAIDESPHYGPRFKAHEKARLGLRFLFELSAVDPWHVAIAVEEGRIVGFILTVPDCGVLLASWAYVIPELRAKAVGVKLTRTMVRHWDGTAFHKAVCYVRPQNRTSLALLERVGFRRVATLTQHIFGEDYVLLERAFTRATDVYEAGLGGGALGRLIRLLTAVLPRRSPIGAAVEA